MFVTVQYDMVPKSCYGLGNWSSTEKSNDGYFFLSPRPDRDPPSLLSNKYRKLLPKRERERGVKLTTHLHVMPRL
jgi:hypothetical protein